MVCAAIDNSTGNKVAIKKNPRVFDDIRETKRILREMEIITTLDHTNIVKLKHFIRPQNKDTFQDVYCVMDLYDADLHRIIKSGQMLTEEHRQYFMIQAFRGLNYLHSAKVMHRDLKPSNLLVNADCALAICDFGLARDDQTQTAELTQYVVTRWYRPPELLDTGSNMYSNAVDIWSLGLILAELLVGKALLPGSDYIRQLNMIVNLLGTPSVEEMEFLSADAKLFLQNQPIRRKRPFTEIFPMASPEAADLLSKILVFHPAKRLTAKQVIEHPYFQKFRDPSEERTAEKPFVWRHINDTPEELRENFWRLIVAHSPS